MTFTPDQWNSTCCSDCCVGPLPEPWKSHGDEAWSEPIPCAAGCPCYVGAANFEALGMFEEDSPLPGCCRSYGCCAFLSMWGVLPVVGGLFGACTAPPLVCLLDRAEERMGIEPSGFCVQCTKAQAPGLVHMQVLVAPPTDTALSRGP